MSSSTQTNPGSGSASGSGSNSGSTKPTSNPANSASGTGSSAARASGSTAASASCSTAAPASGSTDVHDWAYPADSDPASDPGTGSIFGNFGSDLLDSEDYGSGSRGTLSSDDKPYSPETPGKPHPEKIKPIKGNFWDKHDNKWGR